MKIVTAQIMRELDQRAIEQEGIPGVVLMENAGRAVFEFLAERYGPLRNRRFHVLCGTGNNGGDGFVVARYLKLAGAQVSLSLFGDPEHISGDARIHYELSTRIGILPQPNYPGNSIKVDALLGTGSRGAPRGEMAEAIRWINTDPLPTISVDIPSGVDPDTGATPGEAVRATATVTFAYPKLGLFLPPGDECVGELVVRNIGFPWDVMVSETPYRWIRPESLSVGLPQRPREAHKGLFGHLLIVGGSRGMIGAPSLAAVAALRAGAGLVTVAAPQSAQALIAGKLLEAMTLPLPEKDGALCEASFPALEKIVERCDVVCLGPGATQESEAQELMLRALREIPKPIVLDADGLNALARRPETLHERVAPTILTPHPGECARLLGRTSDAVQSDRIMSAREAADRFHAVVVLKGSRTLVCDGRYTRGEDTLGVGELPVGINTTGNPGMATGGSGDVLTGIIGALVGQRLDPFDAACLGVYLHGRAGDLAAAHKGETAMIAGDIIECLPNAIRELEEYL
jgi:hydroxyethylthiazole kinase-like uncharacterized protein yjeF